MTVPSYDAKARKLAHKVVDLLFDHIQNVDDGPAVQWTSAAELAGRVSLQNGESGERQFLGGVEDLIRHANHLHHRGYMGHQVCPPFPAAAIADLVISTLNQSTAVWEMSPLATVVEREVIRWLADLAGYPAEAEGTTVSGGSAANLTALLAARARWRHSEEEQRRAVVLCSADTHYSVARAAAIMGIGRSDVIKIPTDDRHRMDLGELEMTLGALESDGVSPLAIVATSGSTATGAFDQLSDIAMLRDRYRTWLHVDAAHGASVLLSQRLKHLVDGLERADSLSWDPHKMMWMPLSLGVVLVRNGNWLRNAFEADAPYLFHADRASENLGQMTIQCSRRADAVKLWLSLRAVGPRAFEEALDHVAETTRALYELVAASDDFEAMHEPDFNILCFRYRPPGMADDASLDALNDRLRQKVLESGEAWITTTVLRGRRVLRVTVINPRTDRSDIERMIDTVRNAAAEEGAAAAAG